MAVWFETSGGPRPDAAWSLYHENSKRGRRLGGDARDDQPATFAAERYAPAEDAIVLPAARPLIRVAADHAAGTGQTAGGAMPLLTLSAIVATACRPMGSFDPTACLLHAAAVETLGPGLYRSADQGRALVPLGGPDIGARLTAAMPETGFPGRPQAVLFFVGALESAAAAAGERGYRRTLVSVGRHAFALDLAAAAAGVLCREVTNFYDREVDALLGLDGLSESVLYASVLGVPGDGEG